MKKRAIFHNILGSFSNFAFLFLTSIVLLPFYFKFISTADYGVWLGGISFLSLVAVLEANISFILTQQLGEKWTNNKPSEFARYLSAAFFFGLLASLVIIVSSFFCKEKLTSWVNPGQLANSHFADSFFLYAISLAFTITFGYLNCVTQVFLRTLLSPIFNIIASIAGIAYTIWAVPTQGILAIAAGNLVKSVIYSSLVSIYVLVLLKEKNVPIAFEINYLWSLIKNIGLPFVSKVAMTLAISIQNFIVATTISAEATTIFDITKKIPLITQMLINMIAVSTFTSFSLLYSEQKSKGLHEYTSQYFSLIRVLLLLSLSVIFLIGQDFITFWVGFDKFGGNILLALLCLTALTDQLRQILSQQYYAVGNFNLTAVTDSIFAVAFMIIAFCLIPSMKLYGIVLAGIFANIIYFSACFFLERKQRIDMVPQILNKHFITDFLLVIAVTLLSKFLFESIRGNLFGEIAIASSALTVLCLLLYFRERSLFNFVLTKFGKTVKIQ